MSQSMIFQLFLDIIWFEPVLSEDKVTVPLFRHEQATPRSQV